MKCECGSVLFNIDIIPCCDDCSENGAHDEGVLIYDEKEIDEKELIRSQVNENEECRFGTAFGAGCYLFVCHGCNKKTNLPLMDGC